MTQSNDTIVAVGSPLGRSPRGLVRISGPAVMPILGELIQPPDTGVDQLQVWPLPRRLVACRLRLVGRQTPPGGDRPALPALIVLFLAPASYSGQDMAEIQCPGNPALLDRLIQRVVELGARLAQGGEFTFRAFLAGKLDLTQAEGVAATIAATSDSQLQAATMLRRGLLGQFAAELTTELADQLAIVEAGIDFVDQEDVVPITPEKLSDNLNHLSRRLDNLLAQSRSWGAVETLPKVVLVGAPSSGKSTLFNALLGQQRAVIAAAAGTTRDVLTEPWTLSDNTGRRFEVMLVDIAGLDTPLTALDRQIQTAAQHAIDQADLILHIRDDQGAPSIRHQGTPEIRVRSKADLLRQAVANETDDDRFDVTVSARTGQGLDALRAMIIQRLGDRSVSISAQMLTLQPRHEAALRQTQHHLHTARQILAHQRQDRTIKQIELIAAALRTALDEIAGLGGRMTPEDVLGRVFATFCIGK